MLQVKSLQGGVKTMEQRCKCADSGCKVPLYG